MWVFQSLTCQSSFRSLPVLACNDFNICLKWQKHTWTLLHHFIWVPSTQNGRCVWSGKSLLELYYIISTPFPQYGHRFIPPSPPPTHTHSLSLSLTHTLTHTPTHTHTHTHTEPGGGGGAEKSSLNDFLHHPTPTTPHSLPRQCIPWKWKLCEK